MNTFSMRSAGWWRWAPPIAALVRKDQPWRNSTGSLSGRPERNPPAGWLHPDHLRVLRREPPDYVIFSYATPIAWRNAGTGCWTQPDARYTVTTARHQHAVRMILGVLDGTIPVPTNS